MSDVRGVRREMQTVLDDQDAIHNLCIGRETLADWIERLKRRKAVRRSAPYVVKRLSAVERTKRKLAYARARRLAEDYPAMSIHQIANAVGLRNAGRVSEALRT